MSSEDKTVTAMFDAWRVRAQALPDQPISIISGLELATEVVALHLSEIDILGLIVMNPDMLDKPACRAGDTLSDVIRKSAAADYRERLRPLVEHALLDMWAGHVRARIVEALEASHKIIVETSAPSAIKSQMAATIDAFRAGGLPVDGAEGFSSILRLGRYFLEEVAEKMRHEGQLSGGGRALSLDEVKHALRLVDDLLQLERTDRHWFRMQLQTEDKRKADETAE